MDDGGSTRKNRLIAAKDAGDDGRLRKVDVRQGLSDGVAGRIRLQLDGLQITVTEETPFFVGTRGQRLGCALSLRQVRRVFDCLRNQLGWVNRGAHANPRIHDLRHAFVVRRLLLWHAQGVDIDRAMLSLSTYLGHAMVTNTYWYLTGVPELMALAAGRFESLMPDSEVRHA